jgi:6-phosphogluconolactonase (cycloisomerase 2 family)
VLAVTNQKSDLVTLFRYRKESGDLDLLRSFPFECPTVAAFHPILL